MSAGPLAARVLSNESNANAANERTLLSVRNLRVEFTTKEGVWRAVRGSDYDIRRRETVGLVGESGSGKTVSALALLGLLGTGQVRVAGSAMFGDRDLLSMGPEELREVRGGSIGMVFQDPLSSLNPVTTIGGQVSEALAIHRGIRGRAARRRVVEMLEHVGIPDAEKRMRAYPHELSGGMRQRVMIAAAVICEPALLIADEPTTALDVTIQAQILELLARLRQELGMAILLITHNLGVVAGLTDRLIVMYAGRIIEQGQTEAVLASSRHPYSLGLLRSIPRLDRSREDRLVPIEGAPPDLRTEQVGCPFRPRCPFAFDRCIERPPLLDAGPDHTSACWLVEDGTNWPK